MRSLLLFFLILFSCHVHALSCGDRVEGRIVLTEDLDCTGVHTFGIELYGENSSIDGNGFSIRVPQASIGVFASGINQKISNLNIISNSRGIGVLGINSHAIELINNRINDAKIGIYLWTDSIDKHEFIVRHNSVREMGEFGLYVPGNKNARFLTGQIYGNDFSGAGDFAIHLTLGEFEANNSNFYNTMTNSKNGLYFSGNELSFEGLTFNEKVMETSFFGFQIDNVNISESEFDSDKDMSESSQIGLSFYQCQLINIDESIVYGEDVGIKVTTESSIQSNVNIVNSEIISNLQYGILIQSFDQTKFNKIRVFNNDLSANPIGQGLMLYGSTQAHSQDTDRNDYSFLERIE